MEWGQNQLSDDGWGTTEAMHWSSDDSGSDESPLTEGADHRLFNPAACTKALQAGTLVLPRHCKHPVAHSRHAARSAVGATGHLHACGHLLCCTSRSYIAWVVTMLKSYPVHWAFSEMAGVCPCVGCCYSASCTSPSVLQPTGRAGVWTTMQWWSPQRTRKTTATRMTRFWWMLWRCLGCLSQLQVRSWLHYVASCHLINELEPTQFSLNRPF